MDIEVMIKPRGRAQRPKDPPADRIPRLTRLMALAIKFEEMVERGEVADFADIARLGYVTRARLTQIMNLLLLAPEIQDEVLTMCDPAGSRSIAEREVRPVTRIAEWSRQRAAWERLKAKHAKRHRQPRKAEVTHA